MMTSDMIKHTLRWTLGACVEWNQWAKQFTDLNGIEFQQFVHRTHNVVWRYLRGQQTLDGSCSDFECTTAIEAKQAFRHFLEQT